MYITNVDATGRKKTNSWHVCGFIQTSGPNLTVVLVFKTSFYGCMYKLLVKKNTSVKHFNDFYTGSK